MKNVAIWRVPIANSFHQVFDEVEASYVWCFSTLGHRVVVTSAAPDPSKFDATFVLAANALMPGQHLPQGSVVLNFEQFPDWKPHLPDMYRGHEIWNYDQVVHERFQAAGLRSRCVPFGWSPALNSYRSLPRTTEFDLFFFGWLTDERMRRIQRLQSAGLRVAVSTDAWGETRAKMVAQSNAVLSLRSYAGSPLMAVRILPLLAMRSVVMSDHFEGMQYHPGIEQAMHLVPSEDDAIVEGALRLCKDEALRQELASKGLAYAKAHPMINGVEAAWNDLMGGRGS